MILALSYYQLKRFKKARKILQLMTLQDPGNIVLRHNLNTLNYESARAIFHKEKREKNEAKKANELLGVIMPVF